MKVPLDWKGPAACDRNGCDRGSVLRGDCRLGKDASGEIPECDFDAARGGDGDSADCADTAAHEEHLVIQLIDVERILADDERLQLRQDEVLNSGSPVGFANSGDASVGLDLDEVPVPRSAHDHALDVGDLDLLAERLGERTVRLSEQASAGSEMFEEGPAVTRQR